MEGYRPTQSKEEDEGQYYPDVEGLRDWMKDQRGEEWVFTNVSMTDKIDKIISDIQLGTAVGVSDGSYKEASGTAAWVLEDSTGEQSIVGRLISPGFASDQSAYRSEISGIYGMVAMVEGIASVWQLKEGKITLGCDGIQAGLQSLDVINRKIVCTQQSFDLLSGIRGYLRDSNITYIYKHIKGHQDENKKLSELDYWEMLNVEMDMLAKDWWTQHHDKAKYSQYHVPKGIWKICLMGNRVCNNLTKYLRESIEGAKAAEYWVDKNSKYTEGAFFDTDWKAMEKAMKSISLRRQQWVTKFESGCCATGKMMHRWKQRLIPTCPRCYVAVEDTDHILKCRSVSSLTIWETSMDKIKKWLIATHTCPDLINILINSLVQWKQGKEMVKPGNLLGRKSDILWKEQMSIGWRNALGGSISTLWGEIQNDYYQLIGSRKRGSTWASGLIQQMWLISWEQWRDRNEALHNTPLAADLTGALSLDRSIWNEWRQGTEDMPRRIKVRFPKEIAAILDKPLETKKQWFSTIRSYREMAGNASIDEFSPPNKKTKRMREWVGLSK